MKLLDFEKAIEALERGNGPVHVLLGNGFSQAWRRDIFSYSALFDRADFKNLSPSGRNAFDVLRTTDFERVMRALRDASLLVKIYQGPHEELANAMTHDANGLREVLVSAIASNHPDMPSEITDAEALACRRFLCHFRHIYTLNYDLLLYWVLMRDELEPKVKCDDGFRSSEDKDAEYVTWEPENIPSQNIHYLHGALHIFDADIEIQKYTWSRTGIRLIDQIRAALQENRFPLFVAEGNSKQKIARIKHSDYLSRSFRSFVQIGGALIVFGVSLSEADNHIIRLLKRSRSKVTDLLLGIYGDPETSLNQSLIERTREIAKVRGMKNPLQVQFFDAASAKVWG